MSKKKFDPIILVQDDGLIIPEVGPWGEKKYKLVGGYCDIFTSGMRYKWDKLVYIDLFSGAGYARIKDTNRILKSSALISLSIPKKFDKYIFCEADEEKLDALKMRIAREFPDANVDFVLGDSNKKENSTKIDDFIRDTNWRTPFKNGEIRSQDFIKYLSDKYDINMKSLGYVEPVDKHRVKIDNKNIPLYYLAFYSKNPRGNDFFTKVQKYQSSQQNLF